MMEKKEKGARLSVFTAGLVKNNPLFVMLLGTCPALAVTKSVEAAFGMGILFTIVLFFSNIFISAIRKIVPDEIRTPVYIIVIATFVTIVKMLSEAFLPDLYNSLGVFISLIVVNCIVLGRAEAFASKNGVVDSMLDGLGNGLGYTLAIMLIALIREVLGNGTITLGDTITYFPHVVIPILNWTEYGSSFNISMSFFQNPAGAFVVFGVILAVIAAINNHKAAKAKALAKKKAAEAAALKAQQAANNGGVK